MITKPIPNKAYVEVGGIYRVIKRQGSLWVRSLNRQLVMIKKGEFVYVEGGKMKLSELARCIKYLEVLHLKMLLPDFKSRSKASPPIESFLVNEFPFGSAFCYVFRGKWTKKKIDGCRTCFCPRKPFEQDDWKRVRKPKDKNKSMPEAEHISCRVLATGKMRSIKDRIQEVEEMSIETIMKYIKKVKLSREQLRQLSLLWHFHVWQQLTVSHIDSNNPNEFKKGYQR
jgi:hypothetical protein